MLRTRKNKRYNEETNDEEDDGGRKYNLRDKIKSQRFEQITDLQNLTGDEVNLKLIQRNGFEKPILVEAPSGLDLTSPPEGFVVRDVGKLVGYDRLIDVMDVRTQKNIEMTMKEWCKYYESRNRDRLLNVISLEFSHTDLEELVDSPKIVKQLDWVDLVWPKFLKESQTESTNTIDKMKYPKVQKYCLMSVKGSYTDFHIDFGGTSVWYHIIRGKKIFWMVPPTELNFQTFEEWTLSGMQQDVFFGDTVEECFRVELSAGNTFFIPSGWIHAVYTVEDSLVFGGNFLHSFGIENQLKVARIEDATKVPLKFRYPFYTEILWYVVQHYVYCLTGKSHLHNSAKNSANVTPEKNLKVVNQPKKGNKRSNLNEDSATESEQDDCDKTKKTRKKKAVTPPPPKRKRGRPPKQKPPPKPIDTEVSDESTEIDSDLEDVKPAKSATCRMTKNSLLRLQYEIDEPSSTVDRQISGASSKTTKCSVDSTKAENCSKSKSNAKTPAIKTELEVDRSVESQVDNSTKSDASNNLVSSHETSLMNGWSSSFTGASKAIWSNPDSEPKESSKIHITKYEINGLKILVKYLSKLSGAKKNLPTLIRNSRALLDDCKKVIAEHENDEPELAVTGIPITTDLLNPKKSDINQLIEQFFKPDVSGSHGAINNNSPTATKSKSDSSTLTMQQRLKYNQTHDHSRVEEKKSTSTTNDATSNRLSANKEAKSLSPSKKSSGSSICPPTSNNTKSASNSATNLPRPKSPLSQPLSNKQYSSKTKATDKSNSILPGSFASLIAATSSAKEVFNVSSADVTSSLFGSNSPNKNTNKDNKSNSTAESAKPNTRSPLEIDISTLYATDSANASTSQKDNSSPKPRSPEPPKISPTKRFITPSQNRVQPKERLIFASAPYVSPVFSAEQSRQSHQWQSAAQSHASHQTHAHQQHVKPHQQLQQLNQQKQPNQRQECPTQSSLREVSESTQASVQSTQAKRSLADQIDPVHLPTTRETMNDDTSKPVSKPLNHERGPLPDQTDSPKVQPSAINVKLDPTATSVVASTGVKDVDTSVKREVSTSIAPGQDLAAATSSSADPSPKILPPSLGTDTVQKPHKPRGPPKKSKEARLALEINYPDLSSSAKQPSVIKSNGDNPVPVTTQNIVVPVTQPITTTSAKPSPSGQQTAQQKDKIKPKAKRVKNPKDSQTPKDLTQQATTPTTNNNDNNTIPALYNTHQQRPSVMPGLVAPISSSNMNLAIQPMKTGQQQYLISRPMLYNGMPNFTSPHMQHMVPTSIPMFTTPVPTSMALPNMQPGARIVWATRPRGIPIGTAAPTAHTAPTVNPTKSNSTTTSKSKKQTAKTSTMPTNLQIRTPDNAALLSLATTALSTAPLPTTPTLSTIRARLPNTGQAFLMNHPGMFAQQYFNPYMQRMPFVHFAPRDGNPTAAAAMMAAGQFRPNNIQRPSHPTTSQLLVPVSNQPGQPRYLITQPGFMAPRPHVAPMFTGHQIPTSLPFTAFQSSAGPSTTKEPVKVKKVKTR